jgi:hypothetical protein
VKITRTCCAAALATLAATAGAHDTWFERLPAAAGEAVLALGTGTQFPAYESGIDARYLVRQGCRDATAAHAMQPLRNEPTALLLRASAGAQTCWAQLEAFTIELPAEKIAVYMHEINANPEVRAAWADIQRRGLPWKERYTKHARIELGGANAQPTTMAMDALLENSGETLTLRVLRDGLPLPGLAVELRGEASRYGIWRRTDAQGRVQVPALPAGRWVLRGTDLRLSSNTPDTWESRFVTLAFEIPQGQNGKSLSSNARSTNQAAAMAVMSSEPPSSTARR